MFPPRRILFPVDFSDRCAEAGRMAETFAGHFEAELTLLYVLEPFAYNDIPMDATASSERRLGNFLNDELRQLDVKRVMLEGDAAPQIVDYARSSGAELILLPTHGYGPFRRLILGSVTAQVLHDANCPVWTGVHMEQMPKLEDIRFRKVVCAVDLGKQSCITLCWASRFASEFGAELDILHVVPGPEEHLTFQPDHGVETAEQLRSLQKSVGCDGKVSVVAGDASEAVCQYARQEDADLLVIGRSVHDGVLGRLRADAYSIIRQSSCPVVSV